MNCTKHGMFVDFIYNHNDKNWHMLICQSALCAHCLSWFKVKHELKSSYKRDDITFPENKLKLVFSDLPLMVNF